MDKVSEHFFQGEFANSLFMASKLAMFGYFDILLYYLMNKNV